MKFYLLPEPLATIDIETLSLDINCVIDEIGMVQTNFLPYPDTSGPVNLREIRFLMNNGIREEADMRLFEYRKYPDVLLQIMEGRTWYDQSMAFREKVLRAAEPTPFQSFKELLASRNASLASSHPRVVAQHLRQFHEEGIIEPIKEIWVNHPQFDLPRLQTLFESYGEWPIWKDFHAEADIASIKKVVRMSARLKGEPDPLVAKEVDKRVAAPPSHTALGDCYYNLWILGKAGYGLHDGSKVVELELSGAV